MVLFLQWLGVALAAATLIAVIAVFVIVFKIVH
jgi:hypothetical protein